MKTRELIPLGIDTYALKFPYHIVSKMTIAKAFPKGLPAEIRFYGEDKETAGTRRMDCKNIALIFPNEVNKAKERGLNLSEYILIKF